MHKSRLSVNTYQTVIIFACTNLIINKISNRALLHKLTIDLFTG